MTMIGAKKKNLRIVTSLYSPLFLVLRGILCLFDSPTNSLSTVPVINHYLQLKHCCEIFKSNPLCQELKTRASKSCCSGQKYSDFVWTPPTEGTVGVKVTFRSHLTYDWITSHTLFMSVRILQLNFHWPTKFFFMTEKDTILQQSYFFIVKYLHGHAVILTTRKRQSDVPQIDTFTFTPSYYTFSIHPPPTHVTTLLIRLLVMTVTWQTSMWLRGAEGNKNKRREGSC